MRIPIAFYGASGLRPSFFRCLSVLLFLMLLFALLFAPKTSALDITFEAIDAGFVTETGGSAKGDGTIAPPATFNYSVGREVHWATGALGSPLASMDRNNYFVFDLFGVSEPVIGASLLLYTGILESVDPSEDFEVVAPVDPGAALPDTVALAVGNSIGPSEFDDPADPLIAVAMALFGNIEGGAPVGLATIDASMDDSFITIPIGDLAYVNAFAGGAFILGGTVPTAPPPGTPQQPFGFTGPDIPGGDPLTPKLVLTFADPQGVPIPSTLLLIVVGLASLGRVRR